MYVVTGITGRVGGITGRTLLDVGLPVRAVVRDATKGVAWKERGCQVALADMNDAPALAAALTCVNGVFVLIPPIFDPTPGFPEVRAIIAAVTTAIETAKPPKVVCLSTIGAQAMQPNLRPRGAREHEADRDSLKNPISPAVTRAGVHAPVSLSRPQATSILP